MTVVMVDNANKPLCHLPLCLVREQKFFYRSVAILLRTREMFIFRWVRPLEIELPVYEPLPAGASAIDFCADKLAGQWNLGDADLKKIAVLKPCPQNEYSYCSLYLAKLRYLNAENLDPALFMAGLNDFTALERLDCSVSPILDYLLFQEKLPQLFA